MSPAGIEPGTFRVTREHAATLPIRRIRENWLGIFLTPFVHFLPYIPRHGGRGRARVWAGVRVWAGARAGGRAGDLFKYIPATRQGAGAGRGRVRVISLSTFPRHGGNGCGRGRAGAAWREWAWVWAGARAGDLFKYIPAPAAAGSPLPPQSPRARRSPHAVPTRSPLPPRHHRSPRAVPPPHQPPRSPCPTPGYLRKRTLFQVALPQPLYIRENWVLNALRESHPQKGVRFADEVTPKGRPPRG